MRGQSQLNGIVTRVAAGRGLIYPLGPCHVFLKPNVEIAEMSRPALWHRQQWYQARGHRTQRERRGLDQKAQHSDRSVDISGNQRFGHNEE